MNTSKTRDDVRLRQAVVVLVIWLFSTLVIGKVLRHDQLSSVAELIALLTQGVAWNLVLSLAVLALASRHFGWSDLGFHRPPFWLTLRLIWFPILLLLPVFGLALAVGLPPPRAIGFLLVNTFLVALSEEWMFRGILFRALAGQRRVWPALLLTSVIFGSIHVLNGFTYSTLTQSSVQAVAAMMTGLLLGALLVRTGSIWPSVLLHMVWNFGLMLVTVEAISQPQPLQPPTLQSLLVALVLVMPNLFYALILLRKVRSQSLTDS